MSLKRHKEDWEELAALLYERLKLNPIRMIALPQEEVRRILSKQGAASCIRIWLMTHGRGSVAASTSSLS